MAKVSSLEKKKKSHLKKIINLKQNLFLNLKKQKKLQMIKIYNQLLKNYLPDLKNYPFFLGANCISNLGSSIRTNIKAVIMAIPVKSPK